MIFPKQFLKWFLIWSWIAKVTLEDFTLQTQILKIRVFFFYIKYLTFLSTIDQNYCNIMHFKRDGKITNSVGIKNDYRVNKS